MRLHPARAVEREFEKYFKASVDAVDEKRLSDLPGPERAAFKRRLRELHPSSFPYCGYRHAYEHLVREEDPVVYGGFQSEYYVNVGSLAHLLFQKWLGVQGQIAGDWKCISCGHMHKLSLHPEKCKSCGHRDLAYEEVGGKWGKRIRWHKDGLFIDKKGRRWIVDYKTSGSSKIWDHKKKGNVFPYPSNKFQIESYVPLAEDAYGEEIYGTILIYVSRDFPTWNYAVVANVISAERKEELRERLTRDDATFGIVLNLKDNPEHIGRLRKRKLCVDREFYDDNVHSSYDPCPLADHCFSSKRSEKVFTQAFKGIPIVVKEDE